MFNHSENLTSDYDINILNDLSNNDAVRCQLTSSATCASPTTLSSSDWMVEFYDCTVGTKEQLTDTGIQVFPNPATDYFQIKLTNKVFSGDVEIAIFNVQGQMVQLDYLRNTQKTVLSKQINIRYLDIGTYFIQITDGKQYAIEKLLILYR